MACVSRATAPTISCFSNRREASCTQASALRAVVFSSLIGQEQRILGHHHHGLLLVVLQQFVGNILLVDHQAEHILTEPAVGHDEAAFLSPVGAPGVLHFPLPCLPVLVEVYGGQRHGVRRPAVEGGDALCLVHTEGHAEERLIVVVLRVGIAALAVKHLPYVVGAVELPSVLDRRDGEFLDVSFIPI